MDASLAAAREALENGSRPQTGQVERDISDSWERSVAHGLDPRGEPRNAVIAYQDLRRERKELAHLMRHVRPELELLSSQIAGTNFMAAFANAEGVILDAIMDNEFAESPCAKAVRVGSIWTEDLRGTNALGLALHTGRAATVTGAEHFFHSHAEVSCVSAPIFGSRGEILGLLDASSEIAARQIHTKALVLLAANNIENRVFVEAHREDYILQFHPRSEYLTTQSVAMLSVDQDGQITGANRRAAEFLTGLDLVGVTSFERLFQNRFSPTLTALLRGEYLRVRDWLNATYFMRVRLTRPRRSNHSVVMNLAAATGGVVRVPTSAEEPIYVDEQVRKALLVGQRAMRHGMPVQIVGPAGSGKTTLARHLHATCSPQGSFIVLSGALAESGDLEVELASQPDQASDWIAKGGTVLVEDTLSRNAMEITSLRDLLHRLTSLNERGLWNVILTETTSDEDDYLNTHHEMLEIATIPISLPELSARTDFDHLATAMMKAISEEHTLSKSACEAMIRHHRIKNLSDLDAELRRLAVHCPAGVIRREHVYKHLNFGSADLEPCGTCRGNPLKEVKCREIRKVYRQNNSNIALTARRLGVSRNTVYKHLAATGLPWP